VNPVNGQLHERHAEFSSSVAIISIAPGAELSSKEWKHLNPSRRFCRLPDVEYVDTCHPSLLRGACFPNFLELWRMIHLEKTSQDQWVCIFGNLLRSETPRGP
jgi:hypothetical protein